MHCTCGARNGYSAVYEDGQQTDLWVCAKCHKPSAAWFARKCGMYVPKDALSMLSVYGRADGIYEINFACKDGVRKKVLAYHPYPFGVGPVNQGRHYLLDLWKKLDESVAELKSRQAPHVDIEPHRTRATAFSEVIHMLMSDFYPTREDVVREALARWEHRNDSPNDHETPGLAEVHWDPTARTAPSASPLPAPTAGRPLEAAEIEAVKAGLSSGMFTVPQLAEMLKTTVNEIEKHR